MENVSEGDSGSRSWTQVLETKSGKGVRADYRVVEASLERRYVFEQIVEGTPFERFVRSARTEVKLAPEDGETEVSIALERRLRGLSRLGGWMMRRAIGRTLDDALTGLARIAAGDPA